MNYQIFGPCTLLRQLWFEEVETDRRIAVADYTKQQGGLEQALGLKIADRIIRNGTVSRESQMLTTALFPASSLLD
jgi:hypothetical protein